jgi:fluoroquinolone resistance protein
VADRRQGTPAPPIDVMIRSENWDGRDLSNESHERVAFIDVDMTESSSRGAQFFECHFRDVRFNASVHEHTAFVACTFAGCTFFDTALTGCKLVGSRFDGCSFDLLKVREGDWSFTGLRNADLHGASFVDVRMREADLSGARCAGATIRGVDLSGASLQKADFSRCDLRGSDLSALDPHTAGLAGAVIDPYQAIVIAAALGLDVRDA